MPTNAPVTVKAVTYSGRGGVEVVALGERQVRPPEADEVRIKIAAAAINPTDILLRDPGMGDLPPPVTPGMDAAGTIEAIGGNVTRFVVGDEVMAVVSPARPDGGAQAAYTVVPASSVVHKPARSTIIEAATLPMNGLTAFYALDHAALTKGQTLAVTGGAGWLAYLTIVIAKLRGLRVIADAKPEEVELVRGYGADVVVDRGPDFAQAVRTVVPDGVDALLDTALLTEAAFPALRDGGLYIPVRFDGKRPDERGILTKMVLVSEVLERTDWLETLRDLVQDGHIVPRVAREFSPEQIVDAQSFLLAGGVRGRPVLVF